MMIKQVVVAALAAVALVGTAFAEGPKDNPMAHQQAELRKAWQQGFEQGYQRAMTYRDNQQAQQRQRRMKQCQEQLKSRDEKKGPKAEGNRRKGPRGEGRKGRKGPRKGNSAKE